MQIKMVEVFPMNATLEIPVYQRNYDWRREQCDKLFSDIENIVETRQAHFLGAIVYKDKKIPGRFNELIIVDGQQRVTSIVILARALHDSTNDAGIRQAIQSNFFRHAVPNPKYPFKLRPTEYDLDIFKKLLSGGGDALDESEKKSRLYESYKIFKDRIAKSKFPVEEIHAALYSLEFVRMILDNERPQQIFESMNSTGKSLTETELIRNFLLMDLDDTAQERLYKGYWLKMERLFNDSAMVEKFMFQYMVARRKSITDMKGDKNIHISQKALYETFKKFFQKNYGGDKAQQCENFLQDMLHNAKFYRRLLFTEADNFDDLSALDKKFYELMFLIKSTSAPIILMYLNERYERGDFDAPTFMKIVDALISLNCRTKVCRQSGADNAQTAGNILNRLDQLSITEDTFWKVITNGNGKYTFPSNEDFRQALLSPDLNLSLKDFCKYLLYSFEREINNVPNFEGYAAAAVELVIPKKITPAWKKYLEGKGDSQAEIWINSLGNLVLVDGDKNTSAAFSAKRDAYATPKFRYTGRLRDFNDWTSRQIRHRAEMFAAAALRIWPIPDEYNVIPENSASEFNLNANFKLFLGTTPAAVSVFGSTKLIGSWRDFLREIARNFYELDREIFRQTVSEINAFAASSERMRAPFEIDSDLYVETSFSADVILKIARLIVEDFDRLSGTNFKDEIWFTLRQS